jgi:hypothetical protein
MTIHRTAADWSNSGRAKTNAPLRRKQIGAAAQTLKFLPITGSREDPLRATRNNRPGTCCSRWDSSPNCR